MLTESSISKVKKIAQKIGKLSDYLTVTRLLRTVKIHNKYIISVNVTSYIAIVKLKGKTKIHGSELYTNTQRM